MKLARFGRKGLERPALIDRDGHLRDLSGYVSDIAGENLSDEILSRLKSVNEADLPLVTEGERQGCCVGSVGKLIGIGLNYADHASEIGRDLPSLPNFFLKATSSISGPFDPLELPPGSTTTDWEVELGVVIGRTCRYTNEADAHGYVAGYCSAADFSERSLQKLGGPTYGKSFDGFGPLGPWLVTPDEIKDVNALSLFCDVDNNRKQDGTTADLIFKVPTLIAYLSRFFTLEPGDVILTGTPAGVGDGRKPPVYLHPNQQVRLGVQNLGVQRHSVAYALPS